MARPGRLLAAAGALAMLAACGAQPTLSPPAPSHQAHDPASDRVVAALGAELGMSFESAGPHHRLGRAPDGVELDLVGVPVEQVILSLPADDLEAGLAYLPHLRDLLHGPDRAYEWVAAMLACRADPERRCDDHFAQGNLEARFSDGGPDYEVVTISRR
jgi:hypothetical protein